MSHLAGLQHCQVVSEKIPKTNPKTRNTNQNTITVHAICEFNRITTKLKF